MANFAGGPAAIPADVDLVVAAALAEDVGSGDLTAALIPAGRSCTADVVCRESAVLAGRPWFDRVFAELDAAVVTRWWFSDGDAIHSGDVVCRVSGPARAIVTGERTALNFLQTLSGTATLTRAYATALAGSRTRVLDTRKTLPGLRAAQKYAVRCGGGVNHRMGLFDAVLIKENHIAAVGSIAAAVAAVRETAPDIRIEVEVENMNELAEAVDAGVEMIMLDDFPVTALREATAFVAGRAVIEISGGVDLAGLAAIRDAGADYISVGALTKHVRAVDFSMRIEER